MLNRKGKVMQLYKGSCHCQGIEFEVKWTLGPALRCDCSLCIRKGAKMIYADESQFTILAGEANLAMYQFNSNIAEHYFCKTCGIYTHHRTRSKPGLFGFNAGCLQGLNVADLDVKMSQGRLR